MDLPYGVSSYSRERGNIAELPVINMIAESAPSNGRLVLISRPGIEEVSEVGAGPINGLFQHDGILAGSLIAVSGSALYKDSTNLGTLDGGGFVSFAGDEEELTICAGQSIWQTDGTTLTAMTFPDDVDVVRVFDLAGYNIGIRANSARFYWRLWGINVWDGLDFATAENEPDRLLDGLAIDDYLVLFGTETVEFWPKTGDPELPFTPTAGRVFEKGIRATGCCTAFDNTVAWVSNENIVYRAGNVPDRISDSGVEERLANSVECRVESFFFEGHEFLKVRGDTFTMLYDAQTGLWSECASYGQTNFRGLCAITGPLFGDDTTGQIWGYSSGYSDNGGVLERRFRAGVELDQAVTINCIRLTANVGQTPHLSGTYADPVVEMRSSRDAGQTWANWEQSPLGAQGNYRERSEWRRCGMFDDPGMLFEFRVTDPVPFRASRVQANPKNGGRSR